MTRIAEWLEDRRTGANMQPFRVIVTDDITGDLRDWTKNADDDADQHTGTVAVYEEDGTPVFTAQALRTMTSNGELIYYPTIAQANLLTQGRYTVVFTVLNAGATARDLFVFGQRVLGVP